MEVRIFWSHKPLGPVCRTGKTKRKRVSWFPTVPATLTVAPRDPINIHKSTERDRVG